MCCCVCALARCLSFVVCCVLVVACCLLFDVCCLALFGVRCLLVGVLVFGVC